MVEEVEFVHSLVLEENLFGPAQMFFSWSLSNGPGIGLQDGVDQLARVNLYSFRAALVANDRFMFMPSLTPFRQSIGEALPVGKEASRLLV